MSWLEDRAVAVVTGAAVGDALGGATEGWTPEQISERYGGRVTGIVAPYYADWRDARPIAPYHKGDGHITDDTLMTQALVEVYAERRDHLDAYAIAEDLVPLLIGEPALDPRAGDRGAAPAADLPGREVAGRTAALRPRRPARGGRRATSSTAVRRCTWRRSGWSTPATRPGAYAEAIDIAAAHQSSYGREAAGVFAAAVAAAFAPGATARSRRRPRRSALAHDGTRAAIERRRRRGARP